MKKTIIFLAAATAFSFMPSSSCDTLLFFKEGATTTVTAYNDDGKMTGTTKSVYSKVSKTGTGASVTVAQENFDKKGKSTAKSEYTITCSSGNLYFDMRVMASDNANANNKDFEMTVEGNDKEFPSDFAVGQALKDARMKMIFKGKENGIVMPMMNVEVNITNRKVEVKESVTTPAGTFECYKITEDVSSKTMFTIKMKSASWFNSEVGVVKTESYKENGKLVGKTELTEYKKP